MARASPSESAGLVSPTGSAKRRGGNNNLLRDYYGLGASATSPVVERRLSDNRPSSSGGRGGDATGPASSRIGKETTIADPTDPDGTTFNVDLAFKKLLQQYGLAQLLKEESTLLTNIRELDGERQSLVYNHHHELVSASETMRKMKERADDLLPSLNSLQTSLQSISSTSDSLLFPKDLVAASSSEIETLTDARPVIELPQRLRDLILLDEAGAGLARAQSLWGSLESVLAAWDETGVKGAKDIMHNCRHVLREAQQSVKN